MDMNDLPLRKSQTLDDLCKEDLSPLSIHELEARVSRLESEILRVKADMKAKNASRLAAESFFKS